MTLAEDKPKVVKVIFSDGSQKVITRETYSIIEAIITAKLIQHVPSRMDDPEYNLQLVSGNQS